MTMDKKSKMGRPPLPPGEGKRMPLNMRTTREVRAKLELAAADSGRSLVQEVEHRLEQSFEQDRIALLEAKIDLLLSRDG